MASSIAFTSHVIGRQLGNSSLHVTGSPSAVANRVVSRTDILGDRDGLLDPIRLHSSHRWPNWIAVATPNRRLTGPRVELFPKRTGHSDAGTLLRQLLRPHWVSLIVITLSSFLGAALEAVFLVVITAAAMALINGETVVGPVLGLQLPVGMALGVAAGLLLGRLLLNLISMYSAAAMTGAVTAAQRQLLTRAFLFSSWDVQQMEPAGQLQELLTSFINRTNSAISNLTIALTAGLGLVAFLGAGFSVNFFAALAALVALTAVGLALAPLRRLIQRAAASSALTNVAFAKSVSELGMLGQEMQTFGVRQQFRRLIDRLNNENTADQRSVQFLTSIAAPLYLTLAYAAILIGLYALTSLGVPNLAEIGAVMLLMVRSLSYGQQMAGAMSAFSSTVPFLDQTYATTERYLASPAADGTEIPEAVFPITFSEVSYQYTADRPALSEVSFTLKPGEMLGVIGPSGAGKSTLAQLILGLRSPSEGELLVGGADMRNVSRGWWAERASFVPQEPRLLTGTVAENLRFFRDVSDLQDLRRAAAQANILQDIEALPNGFDTHLGERGSALSGGQRQRLSIARALLTQPELIVLDEPTAALDGISEALIRRTLDDLHGQVTIIIIAHRMSTLETCDRIMVIEDGRVTALDEPSRLQGKSRFYRQALSVAGMLEP